MRQRTFAIVSIFVLFTILIVYFLYSKGSIFLEKQTLSYSECIQFKQTKMPNNILLFGRVDSIDMNDPDWIKTKISLCDTPNSSKRLSSVTVFTPKALKLFYSGSKYIVQGFDSYLWQGLPMSQFTNKVTVDSLVVVRGQTLTTEAEIRSRFANQEGFDCTTSTSCFPLVAFLNTHTPQQNKFIQNIHGKKTMSLILGSLNNNNIVLSDTIGAIDSYQEFKQYSDGLILW